ncbi:nucleotidyltransferase family protein [Lysobacter sp. CFH 32150]|uniref:nucleotidyltransferase family protein n=1 Tax=Lysobacter sp. CFH 32150 TaxID=2927128 RepID=UPI001FA6F019|nr:nucleotidyltransferase family protein [Lysobacter sp. CFH 32150]MCI4567627.1 nucleotidyltransferase family protein [Lysobacter sp. CFH 32150]
MAVDEAIVLVGGLGTRLRAVVSDVPKPLAPVAGRPFLAWMLDHLAAEGMRHVILATGFMADKVEELVGRHWAGMTVDYSPEEQPLGTGGAVRRATSLLREGGGAHIVNGDTFLRYSPQALEAATHRVGATVGVALAHVPDVGRYGAVEFDAGRVSSFREKGRHGPGHINAGCYFMTADALAALPDRENFSLEADVLAPLAMQGGIAAFDYAEQFIDIGVPEDYLRAQALFGAGQ